LLIDARHEGTLVDCTIEFALRGHRDRRRWLRGDGKR
jgi:hypothetical protein